MTANVETVTVELESLLYRCLAPQPCLQLRWIGYSEQPLASYRGHASLAHRCAPVGESPRNLAIAAHPSGALAGCSSVLAPQEFSRRCAAKWL
jgi:hypothetical protein